ncbi:MAG TPA: TetR/AcrR family transcriptional regulator [Candidatus Dormibacteraeota bacterium]
MKVLRLAPATRRAQLLEVGRSIFTERPYDDFSMDQVADLAGVSKALLFHYFPTKRDFYAAVLEEAVGEMLALTEPEPGATSEEQLQIGLERYLDYVSSHSPAYVAVLRGGVGADPKIAGIAEGFRQAMLDRISTALGLDAPAPAQRVAVRGWIGMVEAASLDWIEHGDMARADLVQLLVAAFTWVVELAGIEPPQR